MTQADPVPRPVSSKRIPYDAPSPVEAGRRSMRTA